MYGCDQIENGIAGEGQSRSKEGNFVTTSKSRGIKQQVYLDVIS